MFILKKKLETIHFGVHSWGVADSFFTRLGWEYPQDMRIAFNPPFLCMVHCTKKTTFFCGHGLMKQAVESKMNKKR